MIKKFSSISLMEQYISSRAWGAFSQMDMIVLSEYVSLLRGGDSYLEIGVDYGKSAATAIFSALYNVKFYFCDIVDRRFEGEKPQGAPRYLSRENFFKSQGFNRVAKFLCGDSKEIAKTWDGGLLNMIFIDGDHSYEGVKADIKGWVPHLAKDGWILFHDYDLPTSPGVVQAVDKYIGASPTFTDFFVGKDRYDIATSIVGARKRL